MVRTLIKIELILLYHSVLIYMKSLVTNALNLSSKEITEIKYFENMNKNDVIMLDFRQITEIEGLDTLINLHTLGLQYNKITEIKGLDNLVDLQILNLQYNKITEIKGLNNLINLRELILYSNKITEIKGLYNLIGLQYLHLNDNQIKEIKNLDTLVGLQKLYLSNNQITEIKGIDNLVNLTVLTLSNNKISEIKRLFNFIRLRYIELYNNKITEIKGLDKLVNLQSLCLDNNKITEIKGLDNLVNLQNLDLHNNQIKEIKGLDNLINLKHLDISNNQITELPLSLCNLRNLRSFFYHGNPIEYIPLPVQRWLIRFNRRVTDNNMVYNDKQNIHNQHIQTSFRNSLQNILRDKNLLTLDAVKAEILNNDVLTEQTKREILNYCDDKTAHATYLITYVDLLVYVWSRISRSKNKTELCKALNQEITDGLCMCFTGRMTRLLNCLTGFYGDIELQISDSEQITNIIVALQKKYNSDELVDKVKAELLDRNYSSEVINEWLGYL